MKQYMMVFFFFLSKSDRLLEKNFYVLADMV